MSFRTPIVEEKFKFNMIQSWTFRICVSISETFWWKIRQKRILLPVVLPAVLSVKLLVNFQFNSGRKSVGNSNFCSLIEKKMKFSNTSGRDRKLKMVSKVPPRKVDRGSWRSNWSYLNVISRETQIYSCSDKFVHFGRHG